MESVFQITPRYFPVSADQRLLFTTVRAVGCRSPVSSHQLTHSPLVSRQARRLRGFGLPGSFRSQMKLHSCSHAGKNTLTCDVLLPNRDSYLPVSSFHACFCFFLLVLLTLAPAKEIKANQTECGWFKETERKRVRKENAPGVSNCLDLDLQSAAQVIKKIKKKSGRPHLQHAHDTDTLDTELLRIPRNTQLVVQSASVGGWCCECRVRITPNPRTQSRNTSRPVPSSLSPAFFWAFFFF